MILKMRFTIKKYTYGGIACLKSFVFHNLP